MMCQLEKKEIRQEFFRAPGVKHCPVYAQCLWPDGSPYHDDSLMNWWLEYSTIATVYGINVQVAQTPADFMNLSALPHISFEMENDRTIPLNELEHPESCVYVTGNSHHLAPASTMTDGEIIRVHIPMMLPKEVAPTPEHSFYGFQVIPIALYDRWIKNNASV